MAVKLTTGQVGDITVVYAAGRITRGDGAESFRDAVRDLAIGGHKKLLVNMAEVSYIDSSGIGEMVSGYTAVSKQGGVMKLLKLNNRIREVLRIAHLHTVFEIHEDEATAVTSFN